jgi:hypothetical protein
MSFWASAAAFATDYMSAAAGNSAAGSAAAATQTMQTWDPVSRILRWFES